MSDLKTVENHKVTLDAACKYIHENIGDRTIKTLVILGSGLAHFADSVEDSVTLRYEDIPGFAIPTVEGHIGEIVVGTLAGHPVAVMKGKIFTYEEAGFSGMSVPVRAFHALGAENLLYSASSGSLNLKSDVGSLVMLNDHLNLMGATPITGNNETCFGPRFFDLEFSYDRQFMRLMHEAAVENDIQLFEGVYAGVRGPCFETPAEIRMYKTMGADVIGHSVIPEVILARQCGMKVVAVANVTNLAVGLSSTDVNHEQTLHGANVAMEKVTRLFPAFLAKLNQ
ncbi:TPA: purine-nucleoside phosphorylase [Klebsiella pneumoniae]